MNTPNITVAQRNVVSALNLPFALSDNDIAKQFTPEGDSIPREQRAGTRNPMTRARELAREAMNNQPSKLKVA